jgi:hypothetical protein
MTPRALEVWVRTRKGRNIKTGQTVTGKYPSTIEFNDQTWYWAAADLTKHTITYTETAPIPPA